MQAVKEVFKEFCAKSSMHGIQYFSEKKRHWSERYLRVWVFVSKLLFTIPHIVRKSILNMISSVWNEFLTVQFYKILIIIKFLMIKIRFWWIVAFSVSVWLCGVSIHNIWLKWHKNPVSMSFTENEMPISTIPFPTVTVCPETKTYASKLNLTLAYHELLQGSGNLSDIE